jgi:protein TonB
VPANAPAPASAPKTLRDPKLISSTRPVYPPSARQLNVQGSVTISATIDENGKVVSARALNGPLLLRDPAVDSVKQWKYSPGLADGKPVPSQVTVNVDFRLN